MRKFKITQEFPLYEVYEDGSVFSLRTQTFLTPVFSRGRACYTLCGNNGRRKFMRYQLVLLTFVGPCPAGMEVNHKNGDKSDDRLENLEYVTHADNMAHAYRTGLIDNRGERCATARFNVEQIIEMRTRWAQGESQLAIAARFGVRQGTVQRILTGGSYKEARYQPDTQYQNVSANAPTSEELWKRHPSYPSCEVSSHGKVRNNGKLLKPFLAGRNREYEYVDIHHAGTRCRTSVHRLVALVFLPTLVPILGRWVVHHRDGNTRNNHVENLQWLLNHENLRRENRTCFVDDGAMVTTL